MKKRCVKSFGLDNWTEFHSGRTACGRIQSRYSIQVESFLLSGLRPKTTTGRKKKDTPRSVNQLGLTDCRSSFVCVDSPRIVTAVSTNAGRTPSTPVTPFAPAGANVHSRPQGSWEVLAPERALAEETEPGILCLVSMFSARHGHGVLGRDC